MSKTEAQLYEGMYIISATLSEKARADAFERIKTDITERGGEVKTVHEMGRKKLAYEMAGHREGYYYLVYFEIRSDEIEKMWKGYRLNEDLVRFITLKTDRIMEELKFKTLVEA